MQFTHLRLSNWRNFASVDVPLVPRMFLVGPNASGKSNLLDVFRFLRDIAKPGGGLQKAVADRGGVTSLRCLAARRYPDIAIDVEARDSSDREPLWRYRIEFNQDQQRRCALSKEEIWRNNQRILTRPNEHDETDSARLTQTYLEQVNVNKEFRDLCRFFETVDYLHIVPHIIRAPDRFVGRSEDPFGGDFLERLASTTKRTQEARLRKIGDALKVAVPQLKELCLERDVRGVPHLKALYEHWRPHGAYQDEKLFSDGTLRFLGFLWSLMEGSGPLLLEEPELSLHPAIVRRLPRMIHRLQKAQKTKGRQILMSTHSSDLVSEKGIGADEVLILTPAAEGTTVIVGKDDVQIRKLLEAGASVAQAALPATEPKDAKQLDLLEWRL